MRLHQGSPKSGTRRTALAASCGLAMTERAPSSSIPMRKCRRVRISPSPNSGSCKAHRGVMRTAQERVVAAGPAGTRTVPARGRDADSVRICNILQIGDAGAYVYGRRPVRSGSARQCAVPRSPRSAGRHAIERVLLEAPAPEGSEPMPAGLDRSAIDRIVTIRPGVAQAHAT